MGSKNLKLIVLESASDLGKKVDRHLAKLYGNPDETYIVQSKETWFNDGHGKVELMDTIRGQDVFIFTDIGNYSNTYEMHGFINHTSPNDLATQLKD